MYICSMKRIIFCLLPAILTVVSCEKGNRDYLDALDRAIDMKPVYDSLYVCRQDSLRTLFLSADSDSLRWVRAYEIEKVLFYHDVDSCHRYVREMMRLSGDDPLRRGLSESCYANILFKLDSLTIALDVLEKIDTTGFDAESFGNYAFAGHHIYSKLKGHHPEYEQKRQDLIEKWWQRDSSAIECAYYHIAPLNNAGLYDDAIEKLLACELKSPNDTTKANYYLALEYALKGDEDKAVRHLATSAAYDMRLSVKAYRSLYELARQLFSQGDIRRADRYMRMAHQDAIDSHYAVQYEDIVRSLLDIMNVLLQQEQQKKRAYLLLALASAMLLAVALVSLFLLNKYSKRLDRSRRKINEISKIKEGFLAHYMEKCVDYLNKVDQYRSSLRQTARSEGQSGVMAMLRKPSFADDEFHELLSAFDSTFLGIFPDFVDRVNEHMQPEYRLEMPAKGNLSTELRILALIRMGISRRQKIAKVLNMSVTTVYSYHSLLQKRSLHPDTSFDRIIANL